MSGCAEKRALLSLETLKVSAWPDSLAGPAVMLVAKPATVCGPESWSTVWFGLAGSVKLGASLTALTVIVNVCVSLVSSPPLAVPPSSVRKTLTVAEPFAFAAGV